MSVRHAFAAARRELEDHARRQRGQVKVHAEPGFGRVTRLVPEQDHGLLETFDGREIYFHRNSVADGRFNALRTGMEVRFLEEQDDTGPKASAVMLIGDTRVSAP